MIPSDNTFGFKVFEEKITEQFALMETELHVEVENDKDYFDIELEPLAEIVDMTTFRDVGRSLTKFLKLLPKVCTVGQKRVNITDRVKRWLLVQEEM
jgi:hypothetical protein